MEEVKVVVFWFHLMEQVDQNIIIRMSIRAKLSELTLTRILAKLSLILQMMIQFLRHIMRKSTLILIRTLLFLNTIRAHFRAVDAWDTPPIFGVVVVGAAFFFVFCFVRALLRFEGLEV